MPAAPGVPEATGTVVKVCGWPWLSVRCTLIQNAQSPLLLPSEALLCQLLNVRWVPYKLLGCDA